MGGAGVFRPYQRLKPPKSLFPGSISAGGADVACQEIACRNYPARRLDAAIPHGAADSAFVNADV